MVGFIAGVAVGFAVLVVARGVGRRRWGARAGGRRWRGGRHGLLARLDTTSEQEAVFAQVRSEVQAVLAQLRAELPLTREAAAASVRAEHFDAEGLRERFARHAALLEELQRTALGALARVHEALRPAQRQELAAILAGSAHGCGRPRLAR
ncbi:periplasmic heavy metal sensor [Aggregicoccus sp. 17bor-14]|uniref:periplasmic heavy metal sensor n=1 Tax=Myxococcaceae TaxID=31 RepID=UPI00129C5FFD|nr:MULTISPECIES: periplasmic heavy metal sensor [Myxococcaceae]MBF5042701.1 periplasmic heavy metal sensor [Simulacricoccus sp. 17bor-14]MRI88469.1 periplasmic heavy metal sensor [Aggregicoccus sp. 17bor-14]